MEDLANGNLTDNSSLAQDTTVLTLFLHLLFCLARLFNFLSLQPCFLFQFKSPLMKFPLIPCTPEVVLPTILHNRFCPGSKHLPDRATDSECLRLPLRWSSVSALRVAAILAETSLYTHSYITLVHFRGRQLNKSYSLPTANSQQVLRAERNFWRLAQNHGSPWW